MAVRLSQLPPAARRRLEGVFPAVTRSRKRGLPAELSAGEEEFALQLRSQGPQFPEPVREYRFAADRRWRFDFAWPDWMVAVEIEGGTRGRSRHTSHDGFTRDAEKYAEAQLAGWTVLRVTTEMVQTWEALHLLQRALHPSRFKGGRDV